jgi:FAD/FMN-containing dehydrogenase
VLEFYRRCTASLPDEHVIFAALAHAPDGSGAKLAAMATCHCGPGPAAEDGVRPLKRFGSPVVDNVGRVDYTAFNGRMDAGFPKGALNYWKSSFLGELSDGAIETMVDCFARCPEPMAQLVIEHVHGAATRVPVGDTAFPHRKEGYNLLILAQWLDGARTAANVAWARDTYARMAPFVGKGRYVNYLDVDEPGDSVSAAYGPNYPRLRALKSKYDPHNFFRLNQNVLPLTSAR